MIIQKYKKIIAIEWIFILISIILTVLTGFINNLDGGANMTPILADFFGDYQHNHDYFYMFWQIYLIVSFIRITKWSIKIIKDTKNKGTE